MSEYDALAWSQFGATLAQAHDSGSDGEAENSWEAFSRKRRGGPEVEAALASEEDDAGSDAEAAPLFTLGADEDYTIPKKQCGRKNKVLKELFEEAAHKSISSSSACVPALALKPAGTTGSSIDVLPYADQVHVPMILNAGFVKPMPLGQDVVQAYRSFSLDQSSADAEVLE
eukprot:3404075-Amphidinium_carterae.1